MSSHSRYLLPSSQQIWKLVPWIISPIVSLILLFTWYQGKQFIWGSDNNFPLSLNSIDQYFTLISPSRSLPDPRKLPFDIPWGIILYFARTIGIPWNAPFAQAIMIFGLLTASSILSFLLIRRSTGICSTGLATTGPLILGSLFYTLNLYSGLTIWSAQSYLIFHYCLLPGVILLWDSTLTNRKFIRIIATVIIWNLLLSPSYITVPVVVTDFGIFSLLVAKHFFTAPTRSEKLRTIKAAILLVAGWTIFNLYWIVPNINYFNIEYARGVTAGATQSLLALNSSHLPDALRLSGYFGLSGSFMGSPYFAWSNFFTGPLGNLGYISPILAISVMISLLLRKPFKSTKSNRTIARVFETNSPLAIDKVRHNLLLYSSIAILSLYFVLGIHSPYKSALLILFAIHLSAEFRSIYQRFMGYVPLAYAPLLSVGAYELTRYAKLAFSKLARNINSSRYNRIILACSSIPMIILIICLNIISVWPIWSGQIFSASGILPSNRVSIPTAYSQLSKKISSLGKRVPFISFPAGETGQIYLSWNGGKSGFYGNNPLQSLSGNPLIYLDPSQPGVSRSVKSVLQGGKTACEALQALNVGAVTYDGNANFTILRHLQNWIGISSETTNSTLASLPCLEQPISFGNLQLYIRKDYKPTEVEWVNSSQKGSLQHSQITTANYALTSTGYLVTSSGKPHSGFLVLQHAYDPNWTANGHKPTNFRGLTSFDTHDLTARNTIRIVNQAQIRYEKLLALDLGAILIFLIYWGIIKHSQILMNCLTGHSKIWSKSQSRGNN